MKALPTSARARVSSKARLVVASLEGRTPKGLIRFLGVGIRGLSVDILALGLLERSGVSHVLARIVSLAIATLVTWVLNRTVTFAASGRGRPAEFSRYGLVAMISQSVNYVVFLGVCALFPTLVHSVSAIIGAISAAGFSYMGQRFFTFARRRAAP